MQTHKNIIRFEAPGLGTVTAEKGFKFLDHCGDGCFKTGKNGVTAIFSTGDGKVEFISFENRTLAYVKSAMGYPAYYPVHPTRLDKPVKAVLMDLDGTTVRSEEFWREIIQLTCRSLLGNPKFQLENADLPHVSGHSVSEHLKYCIGKYCPDKTVEEARKFYFEHTGYEMKEILEGRGRKNAFRPSPGIRDFLYELKGMKIKLGLVTSGLYQKAYPEIVSAFDTLGMGDPKDFYDCIITAGYPLGQGAAGTMGELSPKPHPWLYSETCRVGLGIPFEDRHSVLGIEDSGAGICAIKLAGYTAIGIEDGNILHSGTRGLCDHFCRSFEEIINIIK